MRLAPTLLIVSTLCVTVLAGCSSEPVVDQAAMDKWSTKQDAAARGDGVLGALSAPISTRNPKPGVDKGITITFAKATDIEGFDFSCFGGGTMSGTLTTSAGSLGTTNTVESLSCSKGAQPLHLSRAGRTGVDKVGFSAFDASQDSAWQVIIRGN
ncbi:hypothetical protein [Frondihabitans sp. Leaf304]|uniref:hypothetical protein n=1 Tax=Frondihabitans sp. Leaf304 TaxID=1736329 RepID=UPI0006FC389B|nr:hypothetical protein [Frondihabitans sp. Leaf304]KQQ25577.1 hypothetical protein ASF54_14320 [Frondihabitans sp. Leaf304]